MSWNTSFCLKLSIASSSFVIEDRERLYIRELYEIALLITLLLLYLTSVFREKMNYFLTEGGKGNSGVRRKAMAPPAKATK